MTIKESFLQFDKITEKPFVEIKMSEEEEHDNKLFDANYQ